MMRKRMGEKKRAMSVLFILVIIIGLFMNGMTTNSIAQQVWDPTSYKPEITVSIKGNDKLVCGETGTITLLLTNLSSSSPAKNIRFLPDYEHESPFISVKDISETPIKQLGISNATAEIQLSVKTDNLALDGTYPLTFNLTYYNPWDIKFTTEYTVFIELVNYRTNCKLILQPQGSVTAKAGEPFELPITVKNDGNLSARDVRIFITDLSQETFTLSAGVGRYDYYKLFGNETREMSYTLRAAKSLKSGSYPVSFELEYTDERGNLIKEKQQVWIPVAGNEAQVSMLEIMEIKPSHTTIKSDQSFSVHVKVKNSGEYDVTQIKISADGTDSLLAVSQNLFIIPTLKRDEVREVVFNFQPKPGAPRGGVPITIKVEPVEGGENSAVSRAISVFLDSDGTSEAGKNVPKIIVKSYSSEPTLVKAGEQFTLNLEFLNTHSSKTIRNIKGNFVVTESSNETGNVFSPVDCSNTFYIDEIKPKETYEWTLTLYTIPDALSKTYTVNITFDYEDNNGNPYKAEEIIGIPVYQPSRFEVSEFSLPPETFMGQPLYIGFEMYNMGKTDIYNVKLTVEGDFDAQPKSNYFGNFESGRVEFFELNLIPMTIGQSKGRIVFQYENASGEKQELVKDISLNVMEMMMPPEGEGFPVDGRPMPGMEEPPSKGFFGSVWFFIILGIVVIGAVVTVIILVKRKRKKNEEFDF